MLYYHLPGVGVHIANTGAIDYYQDNGIGSTTMVVDPSINRIDWYMYDAYGVTDVLRQNQYTPYKFGGKHGYYTDGDSGMILLGHRYYMPELGKFLTQDPKGHDAGLNLYQYANQNPLRNIDPDGEQGLDSVSTTVREAVRREATNAIRNPREAAHELRLLLEDLQGGSKPAERFVEGALENVEQLASAEARFAQMSNSQIAQQFLRGEAQQQLKRIFGQGAKEALTKLRNFRPGQLPKGLSRDTLEGYLEVARRSVAGGLDKTGVQATRLQIVQRALRALGNRPHF